MSKLNNISEEEKGYLKTILQIEDDEILHQYLGAISSTCFTVRLTKKPLSKSKVVDCEPEEMFSPILFNDNIQLFRKYLIKLKKIKPVIKPTPLTRGTSYNTGFSLDLIEEYKPERRKSFDGVEDSSKKETRKRTLSIGGSIRRRRRKTTCRSTRRRR